MLLKSLSNMYDYLIKHKIFVLESNLFMLEKIEFKLNLKLEFKTLLKAYNMQLT